MSKYWKFKILKIKIWKIKILKRHQTKEKNRRDNDPLDRSIFNLVVLWTGPFWTYRACFYHLISLFERNGPSGRSSFNVLALWACIYHLIPLFERNGFWAGLSLWTYWPFGPVTFERNGPSGLSLLNVLALRACIYNLIALSECNGSSGQPLFNVLALRAYPFWTYWPFEPIPFERIGPSGRPLLNVLALRACIYHLIALSEPNGP
jgi:hypothetical protein